VVLSSPLQTMDTGLTKWSLLGLPTNNKSTNEPPFGLEWIVRRGNLSLKSQGGLREALPIEVEAIQVVLVLKYSKYYGSYR
jgi:hypothetical protein